MSETTKGALELLEEMRKERDELDLLIAGLEKRLGITASPENLEPTNAPKRRPKISVEAIPVGFFHNLTQAAAAEKVLGLNPGHPLTTSEILEAFRRSEMRITSKNAATILYTTLKRSAKFERIAGKKWGLTEWYPEKKRHRDEGESLVSVAE